jgi:hypothetical protein
MRARVKSVEIKKNYVHEKKKIENGHEQKKKKLEQRRQTVYQ